VVESVDDNGFGDKLGILGLASNLDGIDDCAVESMIVMDAFGEALVVEPFLETIVVGAGFLKREASSRSSPSSPATGFAPFSAATRLRSSGSVTERSSARAI